MSTGPGVHFYRALPDARHPVAADKSALGAIPTRAFRHCEATRAENGWGWYFYPPCDVTLRWDGASTIAWWWNDEYVGELDGANSEAAQYPDFADFFDQVAPPACQGYSPPFIGALPEPGLVQVWTGWFISTAPNWSIEQRPVVNRTRPAGYEIREGIVETDRRDDGSAPWFGPFFTNLQLTRTHAHVTLRRYVPLFLARPVTREVYQHAHEFMFSALDATHPDQQWTTEDWARYHATVVVEHPLGQYAVTSRQRPKP